MARTPLFRSLQRAYQLAELSAQKNSPPADEIAEWAVVQRQSRRQFLTTAFQGSVAIGAATVLPSFVWDVGSTVKIAIVGAGMAGLHAGYILKKKGLGNNITIYEASGRTGGRMYTEKLNGNKGTTELGGEFVDSDHKDILKLAKEFGVTILDREKDTLEGELFFMGSKPFKQIDAIRAFGLIREKIAGDVGTAGPLFQKLDHTTMKEYIDGLQTDAWFKKVLEVAYIGEYGLELEEQSSLSFTELVGKQKKGFMMFGESDERYKLLGGNQQLCDRLADNLKDKILLNHKLTAVKNTGSGFTLQFEGEKEEVMADIVIMTLPFTILREVEGMEKLQGMTSEKWKCIQELGYGQNGKYFLDMKERIWRDQGYQGYLFTDKIHSGWDSYHLQQGNTGKSIFSIFLGGKAGAAIGKGKGAEFLPDIATAFTGIQSAYTGFTTQFNWWEHKYTKGSYACYKPGQWTTISGQEGERVGNMLFAGEHCSIDFQGFMNGAAQTGRLAARQVLNMVKR